MLTFVNIAAVISLQDLLTSAGVLKSTKHHLTILKGVTGVLKPGRLTLLLGPPGSGKTSLLKALAGLLRDKTNNEGLQVRCGMVLWYCACGISSTHRGGPRSGLCDASSMFMPLSSTGLAVGPFVMVWNG